MPVNPIQLPNRQQAPKKDPMDLILQGLQIANEVFKVPVAYQQYRATGAEADAKKLANATAPEGYTQVQVPANEAGVVGVGGPEVKPLMPGAYGPESPNVGYGPEIKMIPRMVEGEIKLLPFTSNEQVKQQEANLQKYRGDYTKEMEDVETAALNYGIAMDSYDKALAGDKAQQQALLMNASKILLPGVSRAGDGSALDGPDTIPGEFMKFYNKLLGKSDAKLDANEVRQIKGVVDNAMRTMLGRGYTIQDKYSGFAKRDRIDPANLGMRNLDDIGKRLGPKQDPSGPREKIEVIGGKKYRVRPDGSAEELG